MMSATKPGKKSGPWAAVTWTWDWDALGRLVDYNSEVSYTYDGHDRIATRGTDAFTYGGFGLDPTTTGTETYSRTPGGRLVGITDTSTARLVGLDRHGDLTHLFDPAGQVSDTASYDPFGDLQTATGSFLPQVGFQGDYTDPTSGRVWMGARWYDAGWANFLTRDTRFGELHTPVSLNRYTYAFANPMSYWDPDGEWGELIEFMWADAASARTGIEALERAAIEGRTLEDVYLGQVIAETGGDPAADYADVAEGSYEWFVTQRASGLAEQYEQELTKTAEQELRYAMAVQQTSPTPSQVVGPIGGGDRSSVWSFSWGVSDALDDVGDEIALWEYRATEPVRLAVWHGRRIAECGFTGGDCVEPYGVTNPPSPPPAMSAAERVQRNGAVTGLVVRATELVGGRCETAPNGLVVCTGWLVLTGRKGTTYGEAFVYADENKAERLVSGDVPGLARHEQTHSQQWAWLGALEIVPLYAADWLLALGNGSRQFYESEADLIGGGYYVP